MNGREHRIGKLLFDFGQSHDKPSQQAESRLRANFDSVVLPALQEVLDRIDRPNEAIRLDRLEVTLSGIDTLADKLELSRCIAVALDHALSERSQHSPLDDDIRELAGFLESGQLPWVQPGKILTALCQRLMRPEVSSKHLAQGLRTTLGRLDAARRLVIQCPSPLVWRVIDGLLSDALLVPVVNQNKSPAQSYESVNEAAGQVIQALARGVRPPSVEEVLNLLAQDGDVQNTHLQSAAADDRGKRAIEQLGHPPSRARPIESAGAVLLHPFLQRFFNRAGLLGESGRFLDLAAQQRAVLLTHYLATGNEQAAEPDTPLFKLLCGLPLEASLPRRLNASAREKEEAQCLLSSVIDHWQRLGKTTAAGLREGFLQRPGRLEWRSDGWLLQVEKRGVDVLLQGLPWTLSRLQTPFMHNVIFVEWC